MKLTVLVDNQTRTDKYLLAEPALCFYLQEENKKIFFDLGYSDVFIKNAYKLNINPLKATDIVFSHGHNDHTGGLFYLKQLIQDSADLGIKTDNIKITAHPAVFDLKIDEKIGSIGSPLSKEQIIGLFDINLTKEPYEISKNLIFSGEIENNTSTECPDDSALIYKTEQGLNIITGCSHSGLENIIEHACKITGINKINTVTGGFHLIDKTDDEIKKLGQYLKTKGIKEIYPSHCCSLKSKIILSSFIEVKELLVGDSLEF